MKIKTPKGWSSLTLGQFIQLLDLPETGSKVTDFTNRLSILSGKDPEWLSNNIRGKDLDKLGGKLDFLQKLPKPKKANWFIWKWRMYKRQPFRLTTTSQIADIMKLNEGETNEGARILNVLSVIYYNGKDEQYSGERFQKMKEKLEDLPFDIAYSSSVFFLSGLTNYLLSVLMGYSNLIEKMSLKETKDLQERLQKLNEENGFKGFTNGTTS